MTRKQQGIWDQVFSWWLRTWGSHFLGKESFAFIPLLCPFKGSYFLWEVILCSSCCHSTFPTCIVGKKTVKVSCSLAKWFSSHKKKLVGRTCETGWRKPGFLPPETPTENSVFHQPPEVCLPAQGSCREKATSSFTRIFWSTGQLTNFSGGGQLKDLLYFCPECLEMIQVDDCAFFFQIAWVKPIKDWIGESRDRLRSLQVYWGTKRPPVG